MSSKKNKRTDITVKETFVTGNNAADQNLMVLTLSITFFIGAIVGIGSILFMFYWNQDEGRHWMFLAGLSLIPSLLYWVFQTVRWNYYFVQGYTIEHSEDKWFTYEVGFLIDLAKTVYHVIVGFVGYMLGTLVGAVISVITKFAMSHFSPKIGITLAALVAYAAIIIGLRMRNRAVMKTFAALQEK